MGSWGTALYSNDTSSDVRDICNEIYPFVSAEEGTAIILNEYREIVNSDEADCDSADFWFALADWQWNHGILSDTVKQKAISLLEAHAGIEEWQESRSAQDVKKRLAVMDKLLCQLKSAQPPVKMPKPKLAKAKHKPGDVIVFRTCSKSYEYAESVWNIGACVFADHYTEGVSEKLPKKLSPPYEAYDKYMAILCVGSIEEPYSKYLPDIKEVRSIYAYYDYLSECEPSLDDLKKCGFLPFNIRYVSDRFSPESKNAWTYTFAMFSQSFTKKLGGSEEIVNKLTAFDESERFYALLAQKSYDTEYVLMPGLYDAFDSIYDDKARLEKIGIKLDNLLDPDAKNPALRTPEAVKEAVLASVHAWQMKIYELEHSAAYQNADENERVLMMRSLLKEDLESCE